MAVILIEELKADKWAEIEVEVMQLWDNEHPAIRQVGLLKDDSGIVKFVAWEISDQPLLELDGKYHLSHLPVNEFEGRLSVGIVSTTEIERLKYQAEIPTV